MRDRGIGTRSWTTRAAVLLVMTPLFDTRCGCDEGPTKAHLALGSWLGTAIGLAVLAVRLGPSVVRAVRTAGRRLPFRAATVWWGLVALAVGSAGLGGLFAGSAVVFVAHVVGGRNSSTGGPPDPAYLFVAFLCLGGAASLGALVVGCAVVGRQVRRGIWLAGGAALLALPVLSVLGHPDGWPISLAILTAAVALVLLLARTLPPALDELEVAHDPAVPYPPLRPPGPSAGPRSTAPDAAPTRGRPAPGRSR